MQRAARMKKELQTLERDPPHGVSCWLQNEDKLDVLRAQLIPNESTPYVGGVFELEIGIPERYPFEPPRVKFLTPIYHPNIDTAGRICLDILKLPPHGNWKPAQNIGTILRSIQLLLDDPNPDDSLMSDIAHEFKNDRRLFVHKAHEWTTKYAKHTSTKRERDEDNAEVVTNKKSKHDE